jgi:CRP-like cAMP-binding protein
MQYEMDMETDCGFRENLLQSIPTFPRSAIHRLEEASVSRNYRCGDVIIREGQPSGGIFLLIAGGARQSLSVSDCARREVISLPDISAPAVLGTASCMLGEPSPVTISTSAACEAAFIPQANFLNVLREFPQAGLAMSQLLSEELAHTYARLAELRSAATRQTPSSLLN